MSLPDRLDAFRLAQIPVGGYERHAGRDRGGDDEPAGRIVIHFQAVEAALADPVKTLRYE